MARKKLEGKPEMRATGSKLRAVQLELPEDVHRLLRLEAAREDMSLGELARKLVTDALKAGKRGRVESEG